MNQFTIYANESWCKTRDGKITHCLERDTMAFYHSDYIGRQGRHSISGTIENLICTFKNDIPPYSSQNALDDAMESLINIVVPDLYDIVCKLNTTLTVCVIPRAKVESSYNDNQKLFRQTISNSISILNDNRIIDGTRNILRHTDTATTHRFRSGHGGNGSMPYCGITNDTCTIMNVNGKNILLVDDLYTKSVNIDEDAIQALYNHGASNVYFYSIGKTI